MYSRSRISPSSCQESVFATPEEAYGDLYKEHILRQYHRYIESIWFVGNLKQKVNSYFLSINTILLAALGLSFADLSKSTISLSSMFQSGPWHVALPVIGIVLCSAWWGIIYSYKKKQDMKLAIVQCIEEQLPIAPYTTEVDIIESRFTGVRRSIFKMSLMVPGIFALLYFVLLIFV